MTRTPELSMWNDAFFSFHTSSLLELYRCAYPFRERTLSLLKKMTGQLWLTHQVGLDYHRRRGSVIEETASSVSDEQQENYINSTRATRAYVLSLFVSRVGAPFEDAQARREEADRRLAAGVPPGTTQVKSTDAYADVFIWLQLLEHARTTGRPCVFVVDSAHRDWFWHLDGRPRGPRQELVREMREVAGVELSVETLATFVPQATSYLDWLQRQADDDWGDEETTSSG